MKNIYHIFIYFCIYSFYGWILESAYKSIKGKAFINSGFLYGPFIPIYGAGSLLIYFTSLLLKNNSLIFQIVIYTFIAVLLEYLISYFFEKIFKLKLWDYTDEKYNLHGRICFKFSLIWALLVIFNCEIIQEWTIKFVLLIPYNFIFIASYLLAVYFIIDSILSFKLITKFSGTLSILKETSKIDFLKFEIPDDIKKINLNIKQFLRPIAKFTKLSDEIKTYLLNPKNLIHELFIKKLIKNKTGEDWMNTKYRNAEFINIINEVIQNPEYQKLKFYHHHDKSIYDHNITVALLSFKIGKLLKLKVRELVRGALFHDFFHYNWRNEKFDHGKNHAFEHPKISLKNAEKFYGPLTKIEKDIIVKHMWPLTIIPPKYIESLVVSIVDKIVATKEFVSKKEN